MSNLHQWLNSREERWYHPAHERDNPPVSPYLRYGEHPYLETPGFLTGFSQTFRDSLVEVEIPVLVRTIRGKGELQTVKACAFLPSRTEMNKGDEVGVPEGKPLPLFYDPYIFKAKPSQDQLERFGRSWNPEEPEKGLFYDRAQMYDPKFGWWYYMRTPSTCLLYTSNYKTMIDKDSMYNTPPCWCIYMLGLVLEWLDSKGGVEGMEKIKHAKAQLLYNVLDDSKLFTCPAEKGSRSDMNVTFRSASAELDAKFVAEATEAGFVNLKGHRSVGGMRASIYNAMPTEGVEKLADFIRAFDKAN